MIDLLLPTRSPLRAEVYRTVHTRIYNFVLISFLCFSFVSLVLNAGLWPQSAYDLRTMWGHF